MGYAQGAASYNKMKISYILAAAKNYSTYMQCILCLYIVICIKNHGAIYFLFIIIDTNLLLQQTCTTPGTHA